MFPKKSSILLTVISLALAGYVAAQNQDANSTSASGHAALASPSAAPAAITTADLRMPKALLVSRVVNGLNSRSKSLAQSAAPMPYKHPLHAMMMWSGTQNFVAKFTDNSGTLGNSDIFDSSGSVGIGTTSPQAALDVAGDIIAEGPDSLTYGTVLCCAATGPTGSSLSSSAGFSSSYNGTFFNNNGTGRGDTGAQKNTSLPSWRMALGSGASEWPGSDNFAIGRVAAGGNFLSPSILFSINNAGKIKVAGGVDASGGGIKHARVGGCSATGSTSACSVTVSWSGTAFADTNYTAVCTPDSGGGGTVSVTNKTTSGLTVTLAAGFSSCFGVTGCVNATMSGVECMAMHD